MIMSPEVLFQFLFWTLNKAYQRINDSGVLEPTSCSSPSEADILQFCVMTDTDLKCTT
jgi:hypothetical protein